MDLTSNMDLVSRANAVLAGGRDRTRRSIDLDPEPAFAGNAQGATFTDIDGNSYIDLVMNYGSVLVGYDCLTDASQSVVHRSSQSVASLTCPEEVELAERLVRHFEQQRAQFFVTASDALSAAVRAARRVTGRDLVLSLGFHGWHEWCDYESRLMGSALRRLRADFTNSDLSTMIGGNVAAVVVAPEALQIAKSGGSTTECAERLSLVAQHCRASGAVFLCDETKTGMRGAGNGVSASLDVQPDMVVISKGLANGLPLAALLGKEAVMEGLSHFNIGVTAHSYAPPYRTALNVLEHCETDKMRAFDVRCADWVKELNSRLSSWPVRPSVYSRAVGSLVQLAWPGDKRQVRRLGQTLARSMMNGGVYGHQSHSWALSLSHGPELLDRAADALVSAVGSIND